MCTFIISWQPNEKWPVVIGANRDELITRAWRKPGRHWSDRPEVVAGYDEEEGGSVYETSENEAVQKQKPEMRQRYTSGAWNRSTADQSSLANGMVWCLKRAT